MPADNYGTHMNFGEAQAPSIIDTTGFEARAKAPSIRDTTGFEARAKERSARYSDLKKRICGLGLPATCPCVKLYHSKQAEHNNTRKVTGALVERHKKGCSVGVRVCRLLVERQQQMQFSLAGLHHEAP